MSQLGVRMNTSLKMLRSSDLDFTQRKIRHFSSFLQLLFEAKEYAADLNCALGVFAIGLDEATESGLNLNDLSWLIQRGLIQHSSDNGSDGSNNGNGVHFDYGSDHRLTATFPEIPPNSSFIITEHGIDSLALSAQELRDPILSMPTQRKPKWHSERHELFVGKQVVKRFRWFAPNQETILEVFEEEGWPARIDDPLPHAGSLSPKRRLSDTIKCLNRNQHTDLLRFRGDGTGEGVLWDLISP